jgi:hypothetical protein
MEDLQTDGGDGQAHPLGLVEEGFLERRVGKGKPVLALAQADLDAVEADLLGERDRLDLAFQLEVPVGHPDLESGGAGGPHAARTREESPGETGGGPAHELAAIDVHGGANCGPI